MSYFVMNFIRTIIEKIKYFFLFKTFDINRIEKDIPFLVRRYNGSKKFVDFRMDYIADVNSRIRDLTDKDIDRIDIQGSCFIINKITNELLRYFKELLSIEDNYRKEDKFFLLKRNTDYDYFLITIDINEKYSITIHWNTNELTNGWLEYHGYDKLPTNIDIGDPELNKEVSIKLRNALQSQKTKLEEWSKNIYL